MSPEVNQILITVFWAFVWGLVAAGVIALIAWVVARSTPSAERARWAALGGALVAIVVFVAGLK